MISTVSEIISSNKRTSLSVNSDLTCQSRYFVAHSMSEYRRIRYKPTKDRSDAFTSRIMLTRIRLICSPLLFNIQFDNLKEFTIAEGAQSVFRHDEISWNARETPIMHAHSAVHECNYESLLCSMDYNNSIDIL